MQAIGRRLRWLSRLAVVLFVSVGVSAGLPAGEPQSLSDVFEARYQHLLQRVEAGELPPETEEEAKAVWVTLRKDVIALDAEVETLKLEVMSQHGARQQAALDQISQKTKEREHRLVRAMQDLDRLNGNEASATASDLPAREGTAQPVASEKEEPEKTIIKPLDIVIELAPEDVSKGDME